MGATLPPTSRDVARLAGVSQTTVSYALTGKGSISAKTRARVRDAAESLGYRPNLAARSMRTRRSGRLAVIIGAAIDNQLRMLTGAGEVAEDAGFTMETHAIEGSVKDRTDQVQVLAESHQYEGILTLVPVLPLPSAGSDGNAPVVAAAAFDTDMHSAGDLADASVVATFVSTLAAAGHHRFVHVAGLQQYASARARKETFLASVEQNGAESLGVLGESWEPESARRAVLALPSDATPFAVVAANDLLAIAVVRAAHERGWSVPGDLVVTGWDNAAFGAYLAPSLTTVDVDLEEAGRRAMRVLVGTLGDTSPPPPGGPLQRIVWRESTGDLPHESRSVVEV